MTETEIAIGRVGVGLVDVLDDPGRHYYVNVYRDGRRTTVAERLSPSEATGLANALRQVGDRLLLQT